MEDYQLWGLGIGAIVFIYCLELRYHAQKLKKKKKPTERQQIKRLQPPTPTIEINTVFHSWNPLVREVIFSRVPLTFSPATLAQTHHRLQSLLSLELEIAFCDPVTQAHNVLHPRLTVSDLLQRYSTYFYHLLDDGQPETLSRIALERQICDDLTRFVSSEGEHAKQLLSGIFQYLTSGVTGVNLKQLQRLAYGLGIPQLLSSLAPLQLYDDWLQDQLESIAYRRFLMAPTHPFLVYDEAAFAMECNEMPINSRSIVSRTLPMFLHSTTESAQALALKMKSTYVCLTSNAQTNTFPDFFRQHHPSSHNKSFEWISDLQTRPSTMTMQTKVPVPVPVEQQQPMKHPTESEIDARVKTDEGIVERLTATLKPLLDAGSRFNLWIGGMDMIDLLLHGESKPTMELDVYLVAEAAELDEQVHELCRAFDPKPSNVMVYDTTACHGPKEVAVHRFQYEIRLPAFGLVLHVFTVPVQQGIVRNDSNATAFYLLAHQPIDALALLLHDDRLWWLDRTVESIISRTQPLRPILTLPPYFHTLFHLLQHGWTITTSLEAWTDFCSNASSSTNTSTVLCRSQKTQAPIKTLMKPLVAVMDVETWSQTSIQDEKRASCHEFFQTYRHWLQASQSS